MKNIFLAFLMMLLPLIVPAQRTIENPVIGVRSTGACTGFFIDKIELSDKYTKFFITYYHGYAEGKFLIVSDTRIVADGKPYKVINAEGIILDEWMLPQEKDGFKTHFVLNFPAIDKSVETIDFIEGDAPKAFDLYDIALTDQAAEKIKQRFFIPDTVKNYAANIKDNGKSLEKNDFTMTSATIKGKIYGYDNRFFPGETAAKFMVKVSIKNPFLCNEDFAAIVKPDNTFEIQVPMTVKHQTVSLSIEPIFNGHVVLSAGKTVEVNFDFTQIYRPWELTDNELPPYFAGENVDLNYALNLPVMSNIFVHWDWVFGEEAQKKVAKFSMSQYKQYILDRYNDYIKRVDTMHITKRAKEFLTLSLKSISAHLLSRAYMDLPSIKARINNDKGPIYMETADKDFMDYPKILDIDNIMMFYTHDMADVFSMWNLSCNQWFQYYRWYRQLETFEAKIWEMLAEREKLSKKEKDIPAAIAKKIRECDTVYTAAETAFIKKYEDKYSQYANAEKQRLVDEEKAFCDDVFSNGEGYFMDFYKLWQQNISYYISKDLVVPDSIVSEIEKMSRPFYAQYIKAKNEEVNAKIAAEKARGGYYAHQPGESIADSLLVDLLKDNHGKVVLIDFWNTWCSPCRAAMKAMEPMKAEFDDKDVAFVYVADYSSPEEEYNAVIANVKGQHHRFHPSVVDALKRKWGFTGIPAYVLIGKDGMVKDQDGHGTEYFRQKINEELKRNYVKCYITGVLSDMSKGSTVIVCPSDFDVRTSNNYITAKANEQGIFTCEVEADKISLYKVFLQEEHQRGMWCEAKFLVENNATVSLDYNGKKWKVLSGGPEQTLKNNMDAEVEQLFLEPWRKLNGQSVERKKIYDKYTAWERDNYKKRPILYNLYEIADALQSSNGIEDERKAEKLEIYHTYFENFRTENPIHNTIRMHETAFKLQPGNPYIDFEVETVDGKRINIEPLYRGKVTLIDFWASWCGSCRKHCKALIPIYEKYKDKGFNVIAIAREETLSDMIRAAEKDGYPWQSYIDLNDQLNVWLKNGLGLGGGGMYLIDSNGTILSNSIDVETLEPLIRQALGIK